MTTLSEAREAVYQRFASNWDTGDAAITLENEKFDGDAQTAPWCRVAVRSQTSGQETLGPVGGRIFRRHATVFVQIFTKKAEGGMSVGSGLAETARNIFEGRSFSGLDFTSVDISESGPDGKWYQHLVEAPFDYDEIK